MKTLRAAENVLLPLVAMPSMPVTKPFIKRSEFLLGDVQSRVIFLLPKGFPLRLLRRERKKEILLICKQLKE